MSKKLNEAYEFYENDKIKEAVKLYEECLNNPVEKEEAAYQLSIIYLDNSYRHSSVDYLDILIDCDNRDNQYDIGIEIVRSKTLRIDLLEKAIILLIKSKKCNKDELNEAFEKYEKSLRINENKDESIKQLVKCFKYFTNSSIYSKAKELLFLLVRNKIKYLINNNENSYLEDAILFLKQNVNIKEMDQVLSELYAKKIEKQIKSNEIYNDEMLETELKNVINNSDKDMLRLKYYYLVAKKFSFNDDEELAIKYYDECIKINPKYSYEKEKYVKEICHKYIDQANFVKALEYSRLLNNKDLIEEIELKKDLYNKKFYETNNYDFVKVYFFTKIDAFKNNIFYLTDYYKSTLVGSYDDRKENEIAKNNYESFISLKKGQYSQNDSSLDFSSLLRTFFKLFSDEWIVCTVPGHEITTNESNPVSRLIDPIICNSINLTLYNRLIQRTETIYPKHIYNAERSKDYKNDMKTMKIDESFDIKGKNVIVVDDITTSGATLIACRNLVLNANAKKCVIVAIGKTRSK